ncbi:MAG: NAD(P)H-hydrate dehydratase [Muribaculaceae bacterium]|nr:NAD(P)H-hydrate dehydratase [Muribaculaceae bacterium]
MKIFTKQEIKAIEEATIRDGVSAIDLIERAGAAVARIIMQRYDKDRQFVFFAGPGKNGADALCAARILWENGFDVDVTLFNILGNRLCNECAEMKKRLLAANFPQKRLAEVIKTFKMPTLTPRHVVIDGLFGRGQNRPLEGGFCTLAETINESNAPVVAIDIPSGMSIDWNPQAVARHIIHASLTIAIQFPHLAFFLPSFSDLCGQWITVDIGLSRQAISKIPARYYLVEKSDVARTLRPRQQFTSKKDYGSAIIYAGCYGMMGAAVMAARGALRAGVGKLTVSSPLCGYNILQSTVPEALYQYVKNDGIINEIKPLHHYDAIAIGPGIGTNDATIAALESFLASYSSPIVLDADALNCIALKPAMLQTIPRESILTPHAGEFDRLFGPQPNSEARLAKAIEMANYYDVFIILKGHYTAVIRHDGKIYFNSSGTPAMATGGSGDVLTGILSALIAQGYHPEIASLAGVFIHGLAGEIAERTEGSYGVTATDIANATGKAIKEIMNK